MAFKDVLLGILTGAAEKTEEISIEAGLQSLHDSEPDVWARICDDMVFASGKLAGHVKGKFPSALVEGLGVAASESQSSNPKV
jgi:hypothetical protein